jgi:hypothetical protein
MLISAAEFKATRLDLLDPLNAAVWKWVDATKRRKVIDVITAPLNRLEAVTTGATGADLHGFIQGCVQAPKHENHYRPGKET